MDEEKQRLLDCLDHQREHVLGILEGLSDEQLRRPVLPSGWHCLGMVKHLALADEHYWFRSIVGGESLDFFPEGDGAEWTVGPDESAEEVFDLYRDEIIAATPVNAAPRQRVQATPRIAMPAPVTAHVHAPVTVLCRGPSLTVDVAGHR